MKKTIFTPEQKAALKNCCLINADTNSMIPLGDLSEVTIENLRIISFDSTIVELNISACSYDDERNFLFRYGKSDGKDLVKRNNMPIQVAKILDEYLEQRKPKVFEQLSVFKNSYFLDTYSNRLFALGAVSELTAQNLKIFTFDRDNNLIELQVDDFSSFDDGDGFELVNGKVFDNVCWREYMPAELLEIFDKYASKIEN